MLGTQRPNSQEINLPRPVTLATQGVRMLENSSVLPPNDSEDFTEPASIHQALWITSLIIYSLAFILGTTGNGLVIWVAGFRMTRTVTTILFLNLASADFAFTAFLPFVITNTILSPHWPFGWLLCKIIGSMSVFNMFASVFLLTLISLDRCITVLWPVWARNHRTHCRAALAASMAWVFALLFSVPTSIFRTVDTENGTSFCYSNLDPWEEAEDDEEYLVLVESRHRSLVLSRFTLGFVIPLLIITVCYGLLAVRLWRGMKMLKSNRPFKVLTAVVAAFFLCWLPYHVVGMIEASVHQNQHLEGVVVYLSPLSSSLAFLNSCLNPFLYVFIGRDFRERLLRSLPAALERALMEESGPTGSPGNTYSSAHTTSEAETKGI